MPHPRPAFRVTAALLALAFTEFLVLALLHRLLPAQASSLWLDLVAAMALLAVGLPLLRWLVLRPLEAEGRRAVAQSRADLEALLDAINESALLISPEGQVLAINKTGAQRLKQTPQAMVGRSLWDFLPPEVAESRKLKLAEVTRSGQPLQFEDTRDGRDYLIRMQPIVDGGGVRLVAVYARDITEAHRWLAMERLLREMDEQLLAGRCPEALLEFFCEAVARTLRLALVAVVRREQEGTLRLMAANGPAARLREALGQSPGEESPAARAVELGEAQLLYLDDAAPAPWCEAARQEGVAAVYSLPIVVRGRIWGALSAYGRAREAFADAELLRLLQRGVTHLAAALAAAFEQAQLRLLQTALATAANAIFITDREGRIEWVNEAFSRLSGYAPEEILGHTPRLLKSGVHDAAYYQNLWSTILAGQTFVSQTTDRRKDGSLYTVHQIITPVPDARGEIQHFIATHEDITDALAAQARIEHLAHFDTVTGLPNRSLFFDRLEQALALARRNGSRVALLFLDLDRFKPVNDTHGHGVGDALLRVVAERLLSCVRETDTVARFAGDEFTVILPGIGHRDDAVRVAEKILEAIGAPFQVAGHVLHIGVSIGIALFPDDATEAQSLIARADTAMYRAKSAGRHTWRNPSQ
jgi:diguanylate cyclase (GGDEF)-like protein/PAS domain S-box-containing protein